MSTTLRSPGRWTRAGWPAAALGVMPQEPPDGSPLLGRENVIITPHTSFYSEESLLELQRKAAEEVVAVLSGRAPRNAVNPEALQTPKPGVQD